MHQGHKIIIEKASSTDSNLIPAKFNQEVTKILYLIIKLGLVLSVVEPYSVCNLYINKNKYKNNVINVSKLLKKRGYTELKTFSVNNGT
jgi:hypothetical protein